MSVLVGTEKLSLAAVGAAAGLASALALTLEVHYRRLIKAEKKAHHARLEALEQLAESERRRVQAERHRAEIQRLAIVGQLSLGVAHEVNNPLAFVKTNLSFLVAENSPEGGARVIIQLPQASAPVRETAASA